MVVSGVKATIALQLYALQSTSLGDDSNEVTHDCFLFQGPRLDLLWTSDAQEVPGADVEHRNGASFPLLSIFTNEFILRHEEFSSGVRDQSRVAASDPIVITRIKAKSCITKSLTNDLTKCAIVGWDCVVVQSEYKLRTSS